MNVVLFWVLLLFAASFLSGWFAATLVYRGKVLLYRDLYEACLLDKATLEEYE